MNETKTIDKTKGHKEGIKRPNKTETVSNHPPEIHKAVETLEEYFKDLIKTEDGENDPAMRQRYVKQLNAFRTIFIYSRQAKMVEEISPFLFIGGIDPSFEEYSLMIRFITENIQMVYLNPHHYPLKHIQTDQDGIVFRTVFEEGEWFDGSHPDSYWCDKCNESIEHHNDLMTHIRRHIERLLEGEETWD